MASVDWSLVEDKVVSGGASVEDIPKLSDESLV